MKLAAGLANKTGRFLAGPSKSPGLGQDEVSGRTLRPRHVSPAALVFAALVVATVGAFFVTTRLKRSAPVIESLTFNRHFSPNGDRRGGTGVFGILPRGNGGVGGAVVGGGGSAGGEVGWGP